LEHVQEKRAPGLIAGGIRFFVRKCDNLKMLERFETALGSLATRGEITMTRANCLLLSAVCALAFAFGTSAMALNPQPLPPGFKQPTSIQASRFSATHQRIWSSLAGLKCPRCASGQHFPN
jgi:hypothetical protein